MQNDEYYEAVEQMKADGDLVPAKGPQVVTNPIAGVSPKLGDGSVRKLLSEQMRTEPRKLQFFPDLLEITDGEEASAYYHRMSALWAHRIWKRRIAKNMLKRRPTTHVRLKGQGARWIYECGLAAQYVLGKLSADYVRARLREPSFARQILPPEPVNA